MIDLKLEFEPQKYSNGFDEHLTYKGWKISFSVPNLDDGDTSILYTASLQDDKGHFKFISAYKMKELCEKIDKK